MPPKTGGKGKTPAKDATLKKKIQDKRSTKSEVFPAQLISEFNVRRGRLIAKEYGIKNAGKYSFPSELVPLIKDQMLLVTDCTVCNGQCQPDHHRFPAVNPVNPVVEDEDDEEVEEEESEDSEDSNASRTSVQDLGAEDSPSRSVINKVGRLENPLDAPVNNGQVQPFADHINGLVAAEGSAAAAGSSTVPPVQSTSRKSASEKGDSDSDSSSSEEEDEAAIRAKVKAVQIRQDKEVAEAKKAQELKKKKAVEMEKAERRKRKEGRAAARAATEKRILEEMEKKHRQTLAAIRNSAVEDDEVFTDVSHPPSRGTSGVDTRHAKSKRSSQASQNNSGTSTRSRNKSRVSFENTTTTRSPRSPRSSSEHQEQDFHPEYRGSSRSHSVSGSSVDMELIMKLMDRQSEQFTAVLEKVAGAGAQGRVPISSLGGFEDVGGAAAPARKESAGTLKMVLSGKSKMARALGVNPGMKLAFTGDTDNIDVSKLRKNMQSGKHRKSGTGFCVRQHIWAHDVVSRASAHLWPKPKPGQEQEFGHWDQSFANFQEGFCQKILIDHEDNINIEIQNKLRFQSYLIRQSYILPWEDILSIVEQFFEAFEFEVVEWDNWADIEKFLNQACEQARLSTFARNCVPAALAAPGQNPMGQPAKKFEGNIKGVTWKYMKDKKICCGFNTGSCEQQDGHTIGKGTVRHWCGGCHGASKGAIKENHPAKTCGKGPWDRSLFQ